MANNSDFLSQFQQKITEVHNLRVNYFSFLLNVFNSLSTAEKECPQLLAALIQKGVNIETTVSPYNCANDNTSQYSCVIQVNNGLITFVWSNKKKQKALRSASILLCAFLNELNELLLNFKKVCNNKKSKMQIINELKQSCKLEYIQITETLSSFSIEIVQVAYFASIGTGKDCKEQVAQQFVNFLKELTNANQQYTFPLLKPELSKGKSSGKIQNQKSKANSNLNSSTIFAPTTSKTNVKKNKPNSKKQRIPKTTTDVVDLIQAEMRAEIMDYEMMFEQFESVDGTIEEKLDNFIHVYPVKIQTKLLNGKKVIQEIILENGAKFDDSTTVNTKNKSTDKSSQEIIARKLFNYLKNKKRPRGFKKVVNDGITTYYY